MEHQHPQPGEQPQQFVGRKPERLILRSAVADRFAYKTLVAENAARTQCGGKVRAQITLEKAGDDDGIEAGRGRWVGDDIARLGEQGHAAFLRLAAQALDCRVCVIPGSYPESAGRQVQGIDAEAAGDALATQAAFRAALRAFSFAWADRASA